MKNAPLERVVDIVNKVIRALNNGMSVDEARDLLAGLKSELVAEFA